MIGKRDEKNDFKFVNLNHFKNQKSIERVMINLLPGDKNLNNTGKLKNKPVNMDWLHIVTITETLLIEEVCGSQHPRSLPVMPTFWNLLHPCVVSSHIIQGLVWQK